MGRPKNWDTLTIEAQDAWRERKRIYERNAPNRITGKTLERRKIWRQENREKLMARSASHYYANRDEILAKKREQNRLKPELIEKRIMKNADKEDPEKIKQKRKRAAELQKIRYYANHEKNLEMKHQWALANREKVLDHRKNRRNRELQADGFGDETKPAKLDMSKVLAFISKKDGPKSAKPITPNMAKVREFIKYA